MGACGFCHAIALANLGSTKGAAWLRQPSKHWVQTEAGTTSLHAGHLVPRRGQPDPLFHSKSQLGTCDKRCSSTASPTAPKLGPWSLVVHNILDVGEAPSVPGHELSGACPTKSSWSLSKGRYLHVQPRLATSTIEGFPLRSVIKLHRSQVRQGKNLRLRWSGESGDNAGSRLGTAPQ